jgi:hypothetical protein
VSFCLRFGVVICSEEESSNKEIGGVLCLLPPHVQEDTELSLEIIASIGSPPISNERTFSAAKKLKEVHNLVCGEPHHHLWMIGTSKKFRGKGFGSKLVRACCTLADRDGTPIYLETDSSANRSFYERFGFVVREQFKIGETDIFGMMRSSQTIGGKLLCPLPVLRLPGSRGAILAVECRGMLDDAEITVEKVEGNRIFAKSSSSSFVALDIYGQPCSSNIPVGTVLRYDPSASDEGKDDDVWAKRMHSLSLFELPYGGNMYQVPKAPRESNLTEFSFPPGASGAHFLGFLMCLTSRNSLPIHFFGSGGAEALIPTWFGDESTVTMRELHEEWNGMLERESGSVNLFFRPTLRRKMISLNPNYVTLQCIVSSSANDLVLQLEHAAISLVVCTSGRTKIVCPWTDAETLGQHFVAYFENWSFRESQLIQKISLLSPEDKSRLKSLSGCGTAAHTGFLIDALLESGRKHANLIAIEDGAATMTYGKLFADAFAVSKMLKETFGVGSGDRIAILCHSSCFYLVGIIGTMLAGACFLPVDPTLPKDRIEFILVDSGCKCVLTTLSSSENLMASADFVFLDEMELVTLGDYSAVLKELKGPIMEKDDEVYIIYTSGSTGNPKGVLVSHRGVLNTLSVFNSYAKFQPGDRCLHFYGLGFDGTVLNIFCPLLGGSTLVCKSDDNFVSQIQNLVPPLNVGMFTPSTLSLLTDAGLIKSFRAVAVGGEALTISLAQRLRKDYPELLLLNIYGPTEASIVSSLSCNNNGFQNLISIGKPIRYLFFFVIYSITSLDSPQEHQLPYCGDRYLQVDALGVCGRDCHWWRRCCQRIFEFARKICL